MSTLCSFAILRTSGDERWRMASSGVSACAFAACGAGAGGAGGGGATDGLGDAADAVGDPSACGVGFGGSTAFAADAGGVFGAASAFAATASPAAPITATTLLTGTVSP